ncbi:hypothetical protein ACFRDV_37290 [Streptomyces fagopyri]|uniref:hypothetical protein n=1 Tax=Streptomyces fagopyri TaxID=2662397 RepID=UPI00369C59BF
MQPKRTKGSARPRRPERPDRPARQPERPDQPARWPERPVQRPEQETDAQRRRRRAQFLRELTEARELRDRVQPRRAKVARLRHAMRMRTFRW